MEREQLSDTAQAIPEGLKENLSEKELCPDDLLKGQEEAFQRDIEKLRSHLSDFVDVDCPACGSQDRVPALEKFGFKYVSCNGCKTLYMSPRPTPSIMSAYYADSENYRYWAKYIFPASEAVRREKIQRPWLERVIGYCTRFDVPRSTLMEVGPGFGIFSALAAQSGKFHRVVAVEPTPEMAKACRSRGVEVIQKPIEEIAGEVDPVNVITAFEVLEHLFEPRRFLNQCARLIRPGGLLVASCPNGLGFDIALLQNQSLAIDPEHVNLFNPSSLALQVGSNGFDVLEVTTPGRLDAEFVHEAILGGRFSVADNPFLTRVLVDEWERLGGPFQRFLAENGLSSHMWLAARKR